MVQEASKIVDMDRKRASSRRPCLVGGWGTKGTNAPHLYLDDGSARIDKKNGTGSWVWKPGGRAGEWLRRAKWESSVVCVALGRVIIVS